MQQWKPEFVEQVKFAETNNPDYQKVFLNLFKDYETYTNLLYRKKRLYIPNNNTLKASIYLNEHDIKVTGYIGIDKTLELIIRNF